MIEVILLVAAGVLTGLLAGLFYAFSVSVNGALGKLTDIEYVRAMRSINRVILNPLFLASFFGPVLLLPLLIIFFNNGFGSTYSLLLLGAAVLYIGGTFGTTIAGNVPLNEALERFNPQGASEKEISEARARFEKPWNRLNTFRMYMAIGATALLVLAAFIR